MIKSVFSSTRRAPPNTMEFKNFLKIGNRKLSIINGELRRNSIRRKSSFFHGNGSGSSSAVRRKATIVLNDEHSFVIYHELTQICQENCQFFENDSSDLGQRFYEQSEIMINHIATARRYVMEFVGFMHEYDFDHRTPGNGYRSLVKAMYAAIDHCVKICSYIAKNRGYLLFRRSVYIKEIEACNCMLDSLCNGFEEALKIKAQCEHGSLIPPGEHKAIALFTMCAAIKPQSFYGRCIGFQYCESIQPFTKLIGIGIAGYAEMYYNKNGNHIMKATSSLFSSSKYYRNPELLAKRFIELSLYSDIDFSKAFLSLTEREFLHTVPNMLCAKVKINKLIEIPPELLELENVDKSDQMVRIPIPSSHLGVAPVTARLLSNVRRAGMIDEQNKLHTHPVANSLLFHCHGGGFVAQSSKSHEIYLREWAAELQVPILSIDYSLAPQAPYPRALEEIFYAYCWAIKNAHLLGTTAERIIVVGDSAGAVLNIALTFKCIEQSVRRPDGVCAIYSPLIVGFDPSPSRVLCGMDVMLPMGFLMGYLKAYLNPSKDQYFNKRKMSKQLKKLNESMATPQRQSIQNNNSSHLHSAKKRLSLAIDRDPALDYEFQIPRDPFISPLYASDEMLKQMPPIKIVAVDNDPFVDDSVTMAKRLKALGKSVGLDVLPGLSHGFLHFVQVSKDANEGNRLCVLRLAELLGTKVAPKYRNSIFA